MTNWVTSGHAHLEIILLAHALGLEFHFWKKLQHKPGIYIFDGWRPLLGRVGPIAEFREHEALCDTEKKHRDYPYAVFVVGFEALG